MIKNIKILSLFFILSFCLSVQVSAEIQFQRVFNTNICNNCIVQDKDGLFWVGTWGKGLLCYNGYKIKQVSKCMPYIHDDKKCHAGFVTAKYVCSQERHISLSRGVPSISGGTVVDI